LPKNISILDALTLYPRYLRKRALDLLVIKRIFKNWLSVLLFRLGFLRYIALEFRNGTTVRIGSQEEYKKFWDSKEGQYALARYYGYDNRIQVQSKILKLKFDDKIIKFSYADDGQLRNIFGTIKENFIDEQFKNLDVKGKNVVDIGANIGDSAMYFALKGAKHVYAFEPYPYSYRFALKNIALNSLKNKVTIINNGVGKNKNKIKIDPNFHNTAGSTLNKFKKGKSIAIITLEDIVNNYLTFRDSAILKVDCEGCEYGVILSTPDNTLKKFNQIMIEYHHGYKNLEAKLRSAGFAVIHTEPILFNDYDGKRIIGMIYARINKF